MSAVGIGEAGDGPGWKTRVAKRGAKSGFLAACDDGSDDLALPQRHCRFFRAQ